MNTVYLFICFAVLNFFHQCLMFAKSRSFTSLVRFIPQYVIHFHAIGTEIVFLTSLSDSMLLVYRNATDFCTSILYPATLLKSMSYSCFMVASFGFSVYIASCHLQTMVVLLFSAIISKNRFSVFSFFIS